MIKKLLPLILLIGLSSCAVYTIGDGKALINAPDQITEPETRIRLIEEKAEEELSLSVGELN